MRPTARGRRTQPNEGLVPISVAQALKQAVGRCRGWNGDGGGAVEGSNNNKAEPAAGTAPRALSDEMSRMRVVSANRHVQLLSENRQQQEEGA